MSKPKDKVFYIGLMFHDAARRHGSVRVVLDQPLEIAPELGEETTVGALASVVDDLSARLWAAGVRPTERVALYKTNNFDIVVLACAIARIGAVPALLSPALSADVVAELLRRLDQPWLITDANTIRGTFAGTPPSDAHRVLVSSGPEPTGTTALADFAGAPPREAARMHPSQPSLITHSSGTTGVPKLAVHCGDSLWHRMRPQQLMAWSIRRETVGLCMTFVHSRFYNALQVFLHYGNPLVVAVDHTPERIGALFARTRPGYVETHPNTYIEWEELVDAPRGPLSNVRAFGGTFDALHPRTIQRMLAASRRRFPVFIQLYGQSETGPVCFRVFTPRSAAEPDARGVGRPIPGFVRMRVTDASGKPVPPGEYGHLEARVRGRILTYLGEHQRYQDVLNGDWWRMGDMGFRDRRGRVYLLDREVDQIDTVDSNLRTEDILMSRLDELREIAVVPDHSGEPVPVVCTRQDRPLDLDRWREATADLPAMAAPVLMPFDEVPRTSTWKVRRLELRKLLDETARAL